MPRRVICIISGIVLLVVLTLAVTSYNQRSQFQFRSASNLATALHAFELNRAMRQLPQPASITLATLVQSGYLSPKDARAFQGMEVTFFPVDPTRPQDIVAQMRFADGTICAALADGSAQQLVPASTNATLSPPSPVGNNQPNAKE